MRQAEEQNKAKNNLLHQTLGRMDLRIIVGYFSLIKSEAVLAYENVGELGKDGKNSTELCQRTQEHNALQNISHWMNYTYNDDYQRQKDC